MEKHLITAQDRNTIELVIGQTDLLQLQIARLEDNQFPIGIVFGLSGVGKSTFAASVHSHMNTQKSKNFEAILHEIEVAEAPEESFINLYESIY